MKLTMLGTGNAMVTKCFNTCFLISDKERYFLVDGGGGNGLLKQFNYLNIDFRDIRDIFVTHKHIDHILGIVWMIRLICQNVNRGLYEGEARIYSHKDVISILTYMAKNLLRKKDFDVIGKNLHLIEVNDGDTATILDRKVAFFDIKSTKADQFGFSMELSDGEKLTCCGDEPYNECEAEYVRDSKFLLHEAFCLHSQADIFKPYEKHHSTAKDACERAEMMNVKNVILYHTEDKNIENRKELYTAEGRKFFSGNIFVPEDLETIEL